MVCALDTGHSVNISETNYGNSSCCGNCVLQNASKEKAENIMVPSIAFTVGSIMTSVFIIGFLENVTIILLFCKRKTLRTNDNLLIIAVAVLNLVQVVFGVPLIMVSSFHRRWIFGDFACRYYAFLTTWTGLSEIFLLSIIALERFNVVVKQHRTITATNKRSLTAVFVCVAHGLIWAAGPLFGWAVYKIDGIGIACSVFWETKSPENLAYGFTVLMFGLVVPLILIVYAYISITIFVCTERRRLIIDYQMTCSTKEMKVAVTAMIMTGAFVVSWIPYATMSMYKLVDDYKRLPLLVIVVPTVLAKCSIIWNPIIYVMRNGRFRKELKHSFAKLRVWLHEMHRQRFRNGNGIQETTV